MRIVVDEIPKEPYRCEYYRDKDEFSWDRCFCIFREEGHRCISTKDCPYFVSFKDMFEDKISDYDC